MDFKQMEQACVAAKYQLQTLTEEQKNQALICVSDSILNHMDEILIANAKDMENGKANNMKPGLLDRLYLDKERVEAIALAVKAVVDLEDPIGEVMETFTPKNQLKIKKVRVPIGIIGIIYEGRPNVTPDAFALCFKTSNVAILKGGSAAIHSNIAITNAIKEGLVDANVNSDVIYLIEDTNRQTTVEFMKCNHFVDLLIPRGSAGLIKTVVENSNIPVIETGTGNCHVYVDDEADFEMACNIIVNAKTQRIGVCNACESLVVHKDIADEFLPMIYSKLKEYNVEFRGDETCVAILKDCVPATDEDYATEYLDYIISCKVVDSVEQAIAHINANNTKHSETIVTKNQEHAKLFLNLVDAACVYHNASTRYTDGGEFGFGAEIGISTQMLHARGPMGLKELTSYKYQIEGNGQTR